MKNPFKVDHRKHGKYRIRPFRQVIQMLFLLLVIWIGVEFVLFVHSLEKSTGTEVQRPPGVEAFLPISALISLRYWLTTGIFNTVHPAALFILLLILTISFLLKKSFCSWICPVGLFSELLSKIHRKIFDRQFKLPTWLDFPLRSLKYLLLLFFLNAIFLEMTITDLENFLYSPYNQVADIKMLKFFSEISATTFWTLVILVLLSLLLPYFWCRYLCPYGALLGAISWLSPWKIQRQKTTCIDCEKCTRVCPASIKVHKLNQVISDECHGCLNCIDVCPVNDTLYLAVTPNKFRLSRKIYALLLVFLFSSGFIIANILGLWQNSITAETYRYHLQHLEDPEYQHNRGQVPEYDKTKWENN
jgi:polyferredoxin